MLSHWGRLRRKINNANFYAHILCFPGLPRIPRAFLLSADDMSHLTFWFNGEPADAAAASSRALHYGDGVFRTLLKYEGQVVDEEAQLRKLLADAAILGLDVRPPLARQLKEEMATASAAEPTAVVKLILSRSGRGRGYVPDTDKSDRWLFVYPAPRYPGSHWNEGIEVARSQWVLGEQPLLAGIKHLNRLEQVLAYRNAPPGIEEVILCDARGNAVCGGRSNLFVITGELLWTPDLRAAGVCGRTRERLLELAEDMGIGLRIGALPWKAVKEADEVLVCNSLIGIWPVRSLEDRHYAAPGSTTEALAERLAHPRLV